MVTPFILIAHKGAAKVKLFSQQLTFEPPNSVNIHKKNIDLESLNKQLCSMNTERQKRTAIILNLVVSLAAGFYILYRLLRFKDWSSFFALLDGRLGPFLCLIIVQLILLAINLGLETAKWRQLSGMIVIQPWKNTFYQVLKGIQSGMVTPARAGETIAKGGLLPQGLRTGGVVLSAAGSMIQNLVLICGGITGIIITRVGKYADNLSDLNEAILKYSVLAVAALVTGVSVAILLVNSYKHHPRINLMYTYLNSLKSIERQRLLAIVLFTSTRYIVFNIQLWLLLGFFGVTGSITDFGLVMLYFAAISLLPTLAIADLGIRSSMALFIFGLLSSNSPAIICPVFLLWIINLAIPALMALIFKTPEASCIAPESSQVKG